MAGHSKFKNIMHRKGAQDKKKAKIFTKILREITVAARNGITDPNFNSRLRIAIEDARDANLPKDRIDNAIKKASSILDQSNYDQVRYEGYGPFGIAFIIETLTDNKNRTASYIRSAFTKYKGMLGETGSVNYLFKRFGLILYPLSIGTNEQLLEAAIIAGAVDCYTTSEQHEIFCDVEQFNEVRKALESSLSLPSSAKLIWKPDISISLTDIDKIKILMKFIEVLEDSDDVQNVWWNFEIPNKLLELLDD